MRTLITLSVAKLRRAMQSADRFRFLLLIVLIVLLCVAPFVSQAAKRKKAAVSPQGEVRNFREYQSVTRTGKVRTAKVKLGEKPPVLTEEQLREREEEMEEGPERIPFPFEPSPGPVPPVVHTDDPPTHLPTPAEIASRQARATAPLGNNDFSVPLTHDMTATESPSHSTTGEPSVAGVGNVIFYTGNWFAAVSTNSGQNFSYINPYTSFPASNGGFCCDQITHYSPRVNKIFWLLQYVKDAKGNNILRLAFADPATPSSFNYTEFSAQTVGFPDGRWFDYPHIAFTNEHIFISSNVFYGAPGTCTSECFGTGIIRIKMSDIFDDGTFSYQVAKYPIGTMRLTEGAKDTMYFACQVNTTTMRIFSWPDDTGTITSTDSAINNYLSLGGDGVATTADGTNFAGRADGRIQGAWVSKGRIGFTWSAKQDPQPDLIKGRPYPYTIIAQYDEATKALVSQQDLWNLVYANIFTTVGVNDAGDLGLMTILGGPAGYPSGRVWVYDDVNTNILDYSGGKTLRTGTNGPTSNRWGDYFAVRQHYGNPNTFIAGDYYLKGGGGASNAVPYVARFGRERDFSPCNVVLSSSVSVGGQGATLNVSAQGLDNCAWVAYSHDPWITITSATSGRGNTTLVLSVAASGNRNRRGTVTIAGKNVAIEQRSCDPAPIDFNTTVSGNLPSDGCRSPIRGSRADRYSFYGVAGQQVVIETTAARLGFFGISDDTYLYLIGPNGQVLAEDNNSGAGLLSRIPASGAFTLPATGGYIIEATTFSVLDTGSYTLRFTTANSVCATPPPGLVGYWPADGNADDPVSGNRGTPQNGVTFVPGKVGQAFNFDGDDDYVSTTPSSAYPTGSSPRTVEMWLKVAPDGTDADKNPIFEYGNSNTREAFGIDTDGRTADGRLKLEIYTWNDDLRIETGVLPGQLFHLAVTYDGDRTIQVLVNNSALYKKVLGGPLNTPTPTQLNIGRSRLINQYFKGQIDELSLYNRALSLDEIRRVYLAGSITKCVTHTLTVATNAAGTANITVSPNDLGGLGNGATPFTRNYTEGTSVMLTAPASTGSVLVFQKWQRDGADFSINRTVQVTLDANRTLTAVYVCPTILLSPTLGFSGSTATAGVLYIGSVSAVPAGTYTYSMTDGILPPGLTLNSQTGIIGGTPSVAATSSFQITATAGGSNCSGSQRYSIIVGCPVFNLPPQNLAEGTVGVDYSQKISVQSGPGLSNLNFARTAGVLPAGLQLNSLTGEIFGKPQAPGRSLFTITITANGNCTASREFSININPSTGPIIVNSLADTATPGDGQCTLREALNNATTGTQTTGGDCGVSLKIGFNVTGQINLTGELPAINRDLMISGPGPDQLDVHRGMGGDYRIFTVNSGNVEISGLKLTNGKAGYGGGVYNSGTLTLTNCVISGNTATKFGILGSSGGGVYNTPSLTGDGGKLTITGCTVSDNMATAEGGGVHSASGQLVITGSTISGNSADNGGGGLNTQNTSASLTNCTISGNRAGNFGGGGGLNHSRLFLSLPLLELTNCTITGNAGGTLGGGIKIFDAAARLKNTLVAANAGPNFGKLGTTTLTSLGNNLDGDGSSGFTNGANGDLVGTPANPLDAKLGPLANNGGPTLTHLLLCGSPAIDKGGNTGAPATDQRGTARPVNGVVDIGALESPSPQPLVFSDEILPAAAVGVRYEKQLGVTDKSLQVAFTLEGGTQPPPDLTLTAGGLLSGTPRSPGLTMLTVKASTASGCSATHRYALGVYQTLPLTDAENAGEARDFFGFAVAISGDLAIVGAREDDVRGNQNQGSVHIFRREGANWVPEQKLTLSDGSADDLFGNSVAISGNTAMIGAKRPKVAGQTAQSVAYIFVRSLIGSPPAPTWSLQGMLSAGDEFPASDPLPFEAVALSGDTAIIGTSNITNNVPKPGAAYVFVRIGTTWMPPQKLTAGNGGTAGDAFGSSVALSGNLALVGANGEDANKGAAYFFERNGATWTPGAKLTAAGAPAQANFGFSVALSGTTALVGAPRENAEQGAAYLFTPDTTGAGWAQQRLTASGGQFGFAVSLSRDKAAIGAPALNEPSPGSAYIFVRNGTTWTQNVRLSAASGENGDGLGFTVGISGDTVIAGAPYDKVGANLFQGSAFIFDLCPTAVVMPNLAAMPAGNVGVPYLQQMSAIGGQPPYSFFLAEGVMAAGLTMSSEGLMTGLPTEKGVFNMMMMATDANGLSGSRAYTLVINQACEAVIVNPATLAEGVSGSKYSQSLSGANGTPPYTFNLSAGALPDGLSLSPAGQLAGTLTESGTFNFTVNARDAINCEGTQAYALTILPAAQARAIRAVAASGTAGGKVVVPIDIIAQGDENALGLSLTFDPSVLGNPMPAIGSDAAGGVAAYNTAQVAAGRLGMLLALPAGQSLSAGTRRIFTITFDVAAGTTLNATEIGFGDQPTAREVISASAATLPASYTHATVAISRGFEADVAPRPEGNGAVTVLDWVQIGRFVAGMDTPAEGGEFQRADCAPVETRGDGRLTVADWVQAARYASAQDPLAPAGGPTAPINSPTVGQPLATYRLPATSPRSVRAIATGGEPGTATLLLEAQGDENALGFSLIFNPSQWRYLSATPGSDAADATINLNTRHASRGRLGVAMALPSGRTFAAGTRQLVAFTFAPVAKGQTTAPAAEMAVALADDPVMREVVAADARPLAAHFASETSAGAGGLLTNVSAASFHTGDLAREQLVAAFGTNLATTTASAAALPLRTELAGTRVVVTDSLGIARAAALLFVSPEQINYQIPAETAEGVAAVTIVSDGKEVALGVASISTVAPDLFTAEANGTGLPAAVALRVSADGTQHFEPVTRFDATLGRFVPMPIDPGPETDRLFLILYGTGVRGRGGLDAVSCTIGGVASNVLYAGPAAEFAGLDQINVLLPRSLTGRGNISVTLAVDGKPSNTVQLNIK